MITHESSLESFIEQFDYVKSNYTPHSFKIDQFEQIVLGGLGGSGIGASLIKTMVYNDCPTPVEVVKDYVLPGYINEKTLVILSSYSGNTEETLSMFEHARTENCTIMIVTAGGQLKELAEKNNLVCYDLPTGYQPRMTIGFGLGFLGRIFGDLLDRDYAAELDEVREFFAENQDRQKASASKIFDFFKSRPRNKFVIVADRYFEPVAVRFTQQLNENSKLEGFVNVLPEANHNVIESYTEKLPTNFILLFSEENPRVAARFDFLTSHLEMDNNKVMPMVVPEVTWKVIFDIIYRLDWVSVHLANEIHSDLMNVPIITELKNFLSDLEIEEVDDEE